MHIGSVMLDVGCWTSTSAWHSQAWASACLGSGAYGRSVQTCQSGQECDQMSFWPISVIVIASILMCSFAALAFSTVESLGVFWRFSSTFISLDDRPCATLSCTLFQIIQCATDSFINFRYLPYRGQSLRCSAAAAAAVVLKSSTLNGTLTGFWIIFC